MRSQKETAQNVLDRIISRQKKDLADSSVSNFHTICKPEVWKPFVIVCCLQLIAMLSCMKMLQIYILKLFGDKFKSSGNFNGTNFEGISTVQDLENGDCIAQPYVVGIIYGSVRTAASLCVTFFIENHKRKITYLISGMSL